MERFQHRVRSLTGDDLGEPVNAATVDVFDTGTLDRPVIYDDNLATPTIKTNPFTTDSQGLFHFLAPNGIYDVRLSEGTPAIASAYTLAGISLGLGDAGVPAYTEAGLPTAGNAAHAGRLARVTDVERGLWMDTGAQWISTAGKIVNVREFGAAGDGVADDTAEMQAAIDAVDTAGGGVILFPQGTYRATATLTLGDNTILRGTGRGSVIIADFTSTLIAGKSAATVRRFWIGLEYLRLNGTDRTNVGSIGVDWRNITSGHIRDVEIINWELGLRMQAPIVPSGGCFYNNISCDIETCGQGMTLGVRANSNWFRGGRCNDCNVSPIIDIDGPTNIVMSGWAIETFAGRTGIRLGSTIATNGSVFTGVRLEAGATGFEVAVNASGVMIFQPHIVNMTTTDITDAAADTVYLHTTRNSPRFNTTLLRFGDVFTFTYLAQVKATTTRELQIRDATDAAFADLLYRNWIADGVTFGSLGAPANGRITYCSDCTKATPCAGGGSGALAKRLNGAWDCD